MANPREAAANANYTGGMAALLFPTHELLRFVLANGVVPRTITDRPARAGHDAKGQPWIEPFQPLPRELLPPLARLGTRGLNIGELPSVRIACWAELLPLRPAPPPDGPVLFQMPAGELSAFAAACRRLSSAPLGIALGTHGEVLCESPPRSIVLRAEEPHCTIEAFVPQAAHLWVRRGWEHPLPGHLNTADGRILFLRPPCRVEARAEPPPQIAWTEFALPNRLPSRHREVQRTPTATVRFRLHATAHTGRELAWVFVGPAAEHFREFCAGANERLLRQFEVAHTHQGGVPRVIVRPVPGLRIPPFLPLAADGFHPDPRLPGLFIPSRRMLRPALRVREMSTLFELGPDRFTWLESGPSGEVHRFAVPTAAFRPVPSLVEYVPPQEERLDADAARPEPFARLRYVAPPPAEEPKLDWGEPPSPRREAVSAETLRPGETPGWFSRSLNRLLRSFRRADPAEDPPEPPRPAAKPRSEVARRLDEKLASPAALVHGQDRATKRHQLETRLLNDFPKLGPTRRASGWTELAEVYGATGNPSDAAICWINAVWDSTAPPTAWLEQWLLAECRAAKQSTPVPSLDRWLSEPGRFGAGRVVAAYAVLAAHQPSPPADLVASLPNVMTFLDQRFDDLPARAAWLARLALTQLCSGDSLGLARWRDRILARLRDKGPGLDLDEPSFLRFHGTASPDRFQTAREWLVRSHKPILDWVGKLGSNGKLQEVGLDSETDCTKAYAELMLAWGLGCLGERTRSRDWAAKARKVLGRPVAANCDPAVHGLLADAFADRIRDVQDGRTPKPGFAPLLRERLDRLTDHLGRYSVEKLCRFSRILEPAGGGRDFLGLNLRAFRGNDVLGERLQLLADRFDPAVLNEEARPILAECVAAPSSANVPRVALTLLELAPQLESSLVSELLALAEPAVSWMEAWFDSLAWGETLTAAKFPHYLMRLLHGAFAAAAWFNHWPAIRPLVEYLVRRSGHDPALRSAVTLGAGSLFRSLRKLGYRAEAEALLTRLDPGRGEWPADSPVLPPAQFGLAVGWFAIGDEDAGNRILNDARNRLFVSRTGDDRDRTELAIAYAEALGFAPPRIALGRLEEIFQLLERVSITGSTNRYFTLKPLQLIDAVVRSVVTDDFALGPAVRGWLDDDEFLIRRRIHRDMSNVLKSGGIA
ncbi:MAG: hypothetical protein U0791_16990 [Gemmataceae bacterium]